MRRSYRMAGDAVKAAVEPGYRHLDTAQVGGCLHGGKAEDRRRIRPPAGSLRSRRIRPPVFSGKRTTERHAPAANERLVFMIGQKAFTL